MPLILNGLCELFEIFFKFLILVLVFLHGLSILRPLEPVEALVLVTRHAAVLLNRAYGANNTSG
jgi:hypothetical protein